MSLIRTRTRVLIVAVCCVALGAAGGVIAGAGAATKHARTTTRSATAKPAQQAKHSRKAGRRRGGLRRLVRRTVHGAFVVHTKAGFRTVTVDRGVVDSVSGNQLKLTEGTAKAAYRTVTLTIGSGARVRDDKRPASLSAVKPGQRVLVLQTPRRTSVIARTPRTHR